MASFVAVVLAFAGFTTYQMVSAANGVFTNPGCNPVDDPNCNPSAPLFLNPNDDSTTVSPTTTGGQIVRTPVQIGYAGNAKELDLFGNTNLQPGSKLQTQGTFNDVAINVTSEGNDAIFATTRGGTSGATKAALKGVASNVNAYGVYAQNTINSSSSFALFADGGSAGNAAQFTGPVKFVRGGGSETATFSVDSTGNINIQTSVAGKGLTVNGTSVGAGQKTFNLTGTGGNGVAVEYPDIKNALGSNQYVVTDVRVMYADNASATDRHWKPLATTAYTYKECTLSAWSSLLEITNPIASPIYRVTYSIDPTQTFACPGAATQPAFTLSHSVQATNQPITTQTSNVASGETWTWTVGSTVVCSGTSPSATCTYNDSTVNVSNTLANPRFVLKTVATHTIKLNTAHPTVKTNDVDTYKANMAQVSPRSPANGYVVSFNNTTTPSLTGHLCGWDFGNGSGYSADAACSTPMSYNYASVGSPPFGGNKTVNLRVKKGSGDYSTISTTFELCTIASQVQDCASDVCAPAGYCILGGGGGGLPLD